MTETASPSSTSWTGEGKTIAFFLVVSALLLAGSRVLGGPLAELLIGGLVTLIGVVSLRSSLRNLREGQLIQDTPTSKVRSMAVGDVELKGKARALGARRRRR